MKVKELIKLLQDSDGEKEVRYSSYSEMIHLSISGVKLSMDSKGEEIIVIEE